LADSAESLGSERGIITKVEVDVALERAIGVERGPAAATHIVALFGALPRELNARPAITIGVAAVEFSRHHDEAQAAEAVIIELDKAGLDQIDSLLIPVVHVGDTPPAYDARTPGHATRVAARGLPGGQARLKVSGLHFDKKIAKAARDLIPLAAGNGQPDWLLAEVELTVVRRRSDGGDSRQ
jgi:hypothetical protein